MILENENKNLQSEIQALRYENQQILDEKMTM